MDGEAEAYLQGAATATTNWERAGGACGTPIFDRVARVHARRWCAGGRELSARLLPPVMTRNLARAEQWVQGMGMGRSLYGSPPIAPGTSHRRKERALAVRGWGWGGLLEGARPIALGASHRREEQTIATLEFLGVLGPPSPRR